MVERDQRTALARRFRRAVVTGGAGFLGSHLCDELVAAGCETVCVDNFCTGSVDNITHLLDHPRFEHVTADVSAGLDIAGPVDLVLHFASPASPPAYSRLPVETMLAGSAGTHNALRLASQRRARFILASTSEVYGDPLRHPQREDYWGNVNPIGPRAVYDEAKRYSEALATTFGREYDVNIGIVRIFNTYGPRLRVDDGRAIPNFVRQALTGESLTITGDGSQTRSLCYVDDTVAGILALACSDYRRPVNIGNSSEVSMVDLATRIRELVGSSSPLVFTDAMEDDPRRRRPDISRAREILGWRPVTALGEGLRRTIAAFEPTVSVAGAKAGTTDMR